MKKVREAVAWLDAERAAWATSAYADLAEWAEANVVLPITSPEPGPIDLSRTPYLIDPLRAISSPWVREISFPAGAQLGKTMLELLLILWTIDESPAECLFLMGRADDATGIAKDRLQPIIEASPALARHFPRLAQQITKKKISGNGSKIYFDTATSPAAVASKPIERGCADEIHLHPPTLNNEGPPQGLLKKRLSNYANHKMLNTSTPTNDGALIWKLYLQGTQRVWHMRCPHCRKLQVAKFGQIKKPKDERDPGRVRDLRLAWYECEFCEKRISENQKHDALSGGAYVAENLMTERPSHESYLVGGINSPWRTYSAIMAEFMEADGDPEKLRVFHNTTLGENFNDRVKSINISARTDAATGHARGILPDDTQLVTAGVDCHGTEKGYYISLWAWGYGRRGWLVDYAHKMTWREVEEFLTGRDWHTADGRIYTPHIGVDSGFDTEEVYLFTRGRYPQWRPTKGDGSHIAGAPIKDSPVDYVGKNKVHYRGFNSLVFNANYFKDVLAYGIEDHEDFPRSIFFPQGDNQQFIDHLKAEHKVRKKGKEGWEIKYQGAHNHYLDSAVIARAMAERQGINRLPSPDVLKAIGAPKPPAQPDRPARPPLPLPHGGRSMASHYATARRR